MRGTVAKKQRMSGLRQKKENRRPAEPGGGLAEPRAYTMSR